MGYYASAFDGNDTHPAEDFNTPPAGRRPAGHGRGPRVRLADRPPAGGRARPPRRRDRRGRQRDAGRHDRRGRALPARRRHRGHLRQARGAPGQRRLRPGRRLEARRPRRRDDHEGRAARPQLGLAAGRGADAVVQRRHVRRARLRAGRADRRRRRRLRLGGEQPDLAGLSGRPQRRPAGGDVRAAEVGRPQRDRDRPGAGLLLPRRLGRPAGLQARGLVRRHDVPDAQGGLVHAGPGRHAGPPRADRHRRQERQADPPDDEAVVRPGRGLHGPRLHQRVAARGVRRGAERAALRLADGDAGDRGAGPGGDARRVLVQGPGLADHRLRLGLRRQRQRGSLHDRADDVVRLRERRHVHPEGRGEGLPRRHGDGLDERDGGDASRRSRRRRRRSSRSPGPARRAATRSASSARSSAS